MEAPALQQYVCVKADSNGDKLTWNAKNDNEKKKKFKYNAITIYYHIHYSH